MVVDVQMLVTSLLERLNSAAKSKYFWAINRVDAPLYLDKVGNWLILSFGESRTLWYFPERRPKKAIGEYANNGTFSRIETSDIPILKFCWADYKGFVSQWSHYIVLVSNKVALINPQGVSFRHAPKSYFSFSLQFFHGRKSLSENCLIPFVIRHDWIV